MDKTDPTIRTATSLDTSTWNTHVDHPLQSWEWGEFRKTMGIDVVRLMKDHSPKDIRPSSVETPVEGWQITFHRIPHTPWTIGYFPKGPAPNKNMIRVLTTLGKQKRAIFIQLEPNVLTSTHHPLPTINSFRPSHHPLFTKYTFVLNLTKSEEALQKSLHPKTRYNIRVAQKHGVIITEDNSPKAFNSYLSLSAETTGRQGFYAHTADYHRHMWTIMHKAGIAHLFTATYQGETLATWILFSWNKRLYYPYGASSRNHRETMAPTLLLWDIIRWAKTKGYSSLDLWGALGPTPDPHDPWFGFHRFKLGFNPELIEYVGSYDLVINPIFYRIYCVADSLRWTVLRLKSLSKS